MLVEIDGIHSYLSVGDRCELQGRNGATVRCEVVGFRDGSALAMPFAALDGIGLGSTVLVDDSPPEIYPDASWLGRVIDGFAEPLDGGLQMDRGAIAYPVRNSPPPAGMRNRVGDKLDLGVRTLNAFLTCCDGQRLGIFDSDKPNEGNLLYFLAGGFLGPEWGSKFNKFIEERDREIKATDILASWKKAKRKLSKGQGSISNEQYIEAVHKLGDWLKQEKNVLTVKQAKNFAHFMHDCPPEPCMAAWALLQKNTKNLFAVHPYIEKLMVARASGQSTDSLEPPDLDEDDSGSTGSTPKPRSKRGRGRR